VKYKEIGIKYIKLCLCSLIPVPFIVMGLSYFNYETDDILITAFLSSAILCEYLIYRRK
jgi:hypothetical protein